MNQTKAIIDQSEEMSFKKQYESKKIELSQFRDSICAVLDITHSTFYDKMKKDSWRMPEKRLIAIWLKLDMDVLFPTKS